MSKVNRRKFISAAVGGAIVAAGGYGYYTYSQSPTSTTPSPTTSPTETLTTTTEPTTIELDADFDYSPKYNYILMCPEETVNFYNLTKYSGDKPEVNWNINGESVSQDWDYSTQLKPGENIIWLTARDDQTSDESSVKIIVDEYRPDYPVKEFNTKIKGITFGTGQPKFGHPIESDGYIDESIEIIRNDLKCNGIKIQGSYNDKIKYAAEKAIELGFDQIVLGPRYIDLEWEPYVNAVRGFSPIAEELRLKSNSIVFQVGLELLLDSRAIFKEATYPLRWANAGQNLQRDPQCHSKLNNFLDDLTNAAGESFKGDMTYCSAYWEKINWDRTDFQFISATEYYDPNYPGGIVGSLNKLKGYGKPVIVGEFGSTTYPGSWEQGGHGWASTGTYDEGAQVQNIERYVDIFNGIGGLYGCYLYMFYEPRNPPNPAIEWSIIKLENGKFARKKSYHYYEKCELSK